MLYKNNYKLPLIKLIPNFITILALISGISSLLFAVEDRWAEAILCIMVASILDGLDGRLARLLNASTPLGAQLDSLCDFINFGVMPGILIYFWSFQNSPQKLISWAATLFYIMCMAFRLARFNILSTETKTDRRLKYFFIGVPAPVGAFLALTPIILTFAWSDYVDMDFCNNWIYLSCHLIIIGVLLASRLPTFSIKHLHIKHEYVWMALIFFVLVALSLFVYFWYVLPLLAIFYIMSLPLSYFIYKNFKI